MQCVLCKATVEDDDQPVEVSLCNSCAAYLDAKFAPVDKLLADPDAQAAIQAEIDADEATQ